MAIARGEFTVTPLYDGVADKLFRAWADNSTGSSRFSTTDSNRLYIGTASGLTAPASPSGYNWTLIKGADGQSAFSIEILSTKPIVGRYDTDFGKLYVRVYQGETEITNTALASNVKWMRKSDNPTKDALWNTKYVKGAKEIPLTAEDFDLNAIFECEYI